MTAGRVDMKVTEAVVTIGVGEEMVVVRLEEAVEEGVGMITQMIMKEAETIIGTRRDSK